MLKGLNEDALFEMVLVPTWSKDLKYRSFMTKLAKEIKTDDLSNLKYILRKTIPGGKMENLTPLQVFTELEERNIVGPEKLGDLRVLLEAIDRPNLLSMVDDFDDSGSGFPLKSKSDNYLEMDGYRVAIERGRHFETTEGEFVEVRSGDNYALTLTNTNNHRCLCNIKIDGHEMFPGGILLNPKQEWTIERPDRQKKEFKFFAIADAPMGSGINKWRKDLNGMIEVVFTPEKADMKVTCVAQGAGTQRLSCSYQTTDSDFVEMVSSSFGSTCATMMIDNWKPIGNKGVKLLEYGFQYCSQVYVYFGGRGGVSMKELLSKKNVKWRAGATTLQDDCEQEFDDGSVLPLDQTLAASLHLRLVAREDVIPAPSTGKCTPLARATLIPPPVPT